MTTNPIQTLDDAACWACVRGENLGRLAVLGPTGIDIFPVNYLVDGRSILFRSAPGTKLADLVDNPDVAFEVDGHDETHRWSVVVRGTASRLGLDTEIEESGVLDLVTDARGEKHNYVRITPAQVTGRRFRWGTA